MGEAMICDFEGHPIISGDGHPDRVVTGTIVPSRADEARLSWGAENNIYQLGHRGYVAAAGGATDCPYTYMQDLAAGRYRLPWEDLVQITDGTGHGFAPPRGSDAPGEDELGECGHGRGHESAPGSFR
jgi:formamidase